MKNRKIEIDNEDKVLLLDSRFYLVIDRSRVWL